MTDSNSELGRNENVMDELDALCTCESEQTKDPIDLCSDVEIRILISALDVEDDSDDEIPGYASSENTDDEIIEIVESSDINDFSEENGTASDVVEVLSDEDEIIKSKTESDIDEESLIEGVDTISITEVVSDAEAITNVNELSVTSVVEDVPTTIAETCVTVEATKIEQIDEIEMESPVAKINEPVVVPKITRATSRKTITTAEPMKPTPTKPTQKEIDADREARTKIVSNKLKWSANASTPAYTMAPAKRLVVEKVGNVSITTKGKAAAMANIQSKRVAEKVKIERKEQDEEYKLKKDTKMQLRHEIVAKEKARAAEAKKAREQLVKEQREAMIKQRKAVNAEEERVKQECEERRDALKKARVHAINTSKVHVSQNKTLLSKNDIQFDNLMTNSDTPPDANPELFQKVLDLLKKEGGNTFNEDSDIAEIMDSNSQGVSKMNKRILLETISNVLQSQQKDFNYSKVNEALTKWAHSLMRPTMESSQEIKSSDNDEAFKHYL
ncbi:hypothetical protein BdWA1_000453 [Babesia duncani]|uniref:Uncharacterized protein n=1 Tax=Babesia duncani TaxID=323732 RepID=A0AAD9UPU6_9APIC|nr:hypothetical protein BdWA1_000453 [Babesia duncani]